MKDKYVEHDFPRYFIFGEYPDGRMVDVSTIDDTIATVSKEQAAKLIADRHAVVDKLCAMARAFEKSNDADFIRFWYGK